MKFFSLTRVEIGRVIRSRQALIMMVISISAPLFGYSIYKPMSSTTIVNLTTSARLIANPSLAGGLIGAAIFALLTLLELDKVHKNRSDVLMDAVASPILLNAARVIGVLFMGTIASFTATAVYLPYTALSMPNIFSLTDYLQAYFLFMMCTILLGILAAAALYQIIRQVNLSFVTFIVLILISMSKINNDSYLLRWVNPLVPSMSDDFGNTLLFRMIAFNRIFWFMIFGGIWLLTLLCIRRYERGLIGSLARNIRNIRNVGISLVTGTLIVCGLMAFTFQPYVDSSPLDPSVDNYGNDNLHLEKTEFDVSLNTATGTLSGAGYYHIHNSSNKKQKEIFLLNPGYTVESVNANGEMIPFTDLKKNINGSKQIEIELPASKNTKLLIKYSGMPRIWWGLLAGEMSGSLISSKYVELGGSSLFPYWMGDTEELTNFTGKITLPKHLTVVATGDKAQVLSENTDGTKTWQVHNQIYSLSLYAGDYVMETLDGANMPVEFYYSKKIQSNMNNLDAKGIMEHTLAYCTKKFGSLPFTSDYPLRLVEIDSFFGGGAAFDNFSIMNETSFNNENLNDLVAASQAELMAHEIIHQWWGLHTKIFDTKEKNWAQDGLTVYTTYRVVKDLYGKEYAQKHYVDKWKQKVENRKANFYNRHPEYLDILPQQYADFITKANESIGQYTEMPLKILKAEKLVGGEEKMDEILAGLFENKDTPISYNDFLKACGLEKEALELD